MSFPSPGWHAGRCPNGGLSNHNTFIQIGFVYHGSTDSIDPVLPSGDRDIFCRAGKLEVDLPLTIFCIQILPYYWILWLEKKIGKFECQKINKNLLLKMVILNENSTQHLNLRNVFKVSLYCYCVNKELFWFLFSKNKFFQHYDGLQR